MPAAAVMAVVAAAVMAAMAAAVVVVVVVVASAVVGRRGKEPHTRNTPADTFHTKHPRAHTPCISDSGTYHGLQHQPEV